MRKSKVIEILRTLSEDELKRFKDFVNSPFHNRNKNVIRLFDNIRKYYPAFDSDRLEKEKVFIKLFPGKVYNDVVMRILISDLLKLSEEFLAYLSYRKQPLQEIKHLLNELMERKLDSLHRSNLRIGEKLLNESIKIDYKYFFELYDIETYRIDFLIENDQQAHTASHVLKQGQYLINLFLFGIFNIAHELTTHREVLNITFDFDLVKKTLECFDLSNLFKYMNENKYEHYPVLSIYYNMFLSCTDPFNVKYYYIMKSLIESNIDKFDIKEKVNLYIILETLCVTQLSAGNEIFYKEMFEIYNLMLKHKIYIHSEKENFQVNLFRNMFFTAVVLKEFVWAENFLKDYIGKLSAEQREDMSHYSKAVLNFEKGEYEKALEELSKVRFKFFVYKYEIRMLTLKIYYEQHSYEAAISLIDTFQHFLSNNKSVPESEKERFGKFLKCLNNLIKIKTGFTSAADFDIKNEIKNSKSIISKRWLLEKVEELIN